MSEPPAPRRIRAQASPRDPRVMRFILDAPVQGNRTASFDGPDDDVPLAKALFAIEGLQNLQVNGETILITRSEDCNWQVLKAPIAAAIRQVLDSTDHPLGEPGTANPADGDDTALLAKVTTLLDRNANPAIASHGGRITAEGVEDGSVYLRMSGGCQGCASSAATLRSGVETMLRAALPDLREIVDVTDHASGTNPFYREAPGQSPTFTRPIPSDVIGWEDGKVVIDPDYLAPRLGLEVSVLHAGLSRGDVIITTDKSPGAKAARTRVIVRSAQRAWAAEILPGGNAREIPPPRTLSKAELSNSKLSHKVRLYLGALPPEKLPITYGGLARGLGMYAPGSVGKITAALEVTMQEDAAAGRPFIAARVVGRGPARLPGKGFFQLARTLGSGPLGGETEQAFHHREMAASLASG